MDTLIIRQKLHDYINDADDDKVESLYIKVIEDTNDRYEWWNDEDMVAELERRSAALESGEDKGIPWEEVKARLHRIML